VVCAGAAVPTGLSAAVRDLAFSAIAYPFAVEKFNPPNDLLALDDALQQLATRHPDIAQLVKLRYFAGLSMEQAAEALGLALRTAERDWAFARAWLRGKHERTSR
jgi:DNA-directed RNA polymerase specialized sigma24 family protein